MRILQLPNFNVKPDRHVPLSSCPKPLLPWSYCACVPAMIVLTVPVPSWYANIFKDKWVNKEDYIKRLLTSYRQTAECWTSLVLNNQRLSTQRASTARIGILKHCYLSLNIPVKEAWMHRPNLTESYNHSHDSKKNHYDNQLHRSDYKWQQFHKLFTGYQMGKNLTQWRQKSYKTMKTSLLTTSTCNLGQSVRWK